MLVIAGNSVTKSSRQVSYLVGRLPRSRMVLAGWGTTWATFDGFVHVDDWVPQRLVTATGPNPLPR
jgi:hypothetical protein